MPVDQNVEIIRQAGQLAIKHPVRRTRQSQSIADDIRTARLSGHQLVNVVRTMHVPTGSKRRRSSQAPGIPRPLTCPPVLRTKRDRFRSAICVEARSCAG